MSNSSKKQVEHKHKAALAMVALIMLLLFVGSVIVLAVRDHDDLDSAVIASDRQSEVEDRVAVGDTISESQIINQAPGLDDSHSGIDDSSKIDIILSEFNLEGDLDRSITQLAEIVDDASNLVQLRQDALDTITLLCFNAANIQCLEGLSDSFKDSVLSTDNLDQKVFELSELENLNPEIID